MTKCKVLKFDSRNTAYYVRQGLSKSRAIDTARELSKIGFGKAQAEGDDGSFETFEKGERTEWSYPNGLGQIKINS